MRFFVLISWHPTLAVSVLQRTNNKSKYSKKNRLKKKKPNTIQIDASGTASIPLTRGNVTDPFERMIRGLMD